MTLKTKFMCAIVLSATVIGCSADDPKIDTSNDFHCAVLSYAWIDYAKAMKRPRTEKKSMELLFNWYMKKAKDSNGRKFSNKELERLAAPVFSSLEGDIYDTREELAECSDRALEKPEFERKID